MLIQNHQNYEVVFSKYTFIITFQQFRKCLFKRHFQLKFKIFKIIESISSKDTFSVFKIMNVSFQKTLLV